MPKTGHFILHSSVLPKVTAGNYELLSEHKDLPFPVEPARTHITVAAPRFTMPTDQILSTFPPANAEGAFGDRLPQIVLKRRTLPWERNPSGSTQPDASLPWLALVVVAEGEAELKLDAPVAECITPGKTFPELATDKDVERSLYLAVTQTVLKKIFPCQEDLALLTHVREVDVHDTELANGDDDGWLAVVLANRLPVFDEARKKPVRYMACLLNLEGQLASLPAPELPVNEFSFELAQDWRVLQNVDLAIGPDPAVMGAQLQGNLALPAVGKGAGAAKAARAAPARAASAAGKRSAATLDGSAQMSQPAQAQQWASVTEQVRAAAAGSDAKQRVRDTMTGGFRLPIQAYAQEKVFRFPVLAHWSFTTNGNDTFETLMHDLDVGLLGTVPAPLPTAPPKREPPEVVQTGHIGLQHRSRRGDPLKAWYRGPCVPFPTLRKADAVAHSADQLRRVVPDGREDLALAAAFEIGRLLALSQLSVVSALLRFRGEQFGAGRVHDLLSRLTPYKLPDLADTRVDLGRFVALQMVGELAGRPDDMLGPRRPVADIGRPIAMAGQLDAVVARGLGLDLDAVRKTGSQVGLLAAVMQAQAPVAFDAGAMRLDGNAAIGLRNALVTELTRTLNVAAPLAGKTKGRGADALDALLAQGGDGDDDADEGDAEVQR